ncbi:hypothetical protein Back11_47580 [Paenibacillus baekrokdamisoli]|uniref:Uncharacterized protein n=1 Tax=Paenibacillus baekrokdamisoli TaxID=1712516 RepID=A0A3G9JEL9_9BACL|nr:hypothetical protein [Paenibacillus baekrokdamisoli]MBB3068579.1 hypothetical protein [Paenibacillus baekrokdamisoli]BBH23413.1 hypothetical protein Back11_47580 [Paenibacillus baekrokdamisoli]
MWKMTGWLVKTVAAGLIISFLSIWTTGYIVNSYVETLLGQFNIPLDKKPFALDGVWGSMWGANPTLKSDSASATDGKASTDKKDAQKSGDGASSGTESPLAIDAFSSNPSGSLSDIGGGSGPKGNSGSSAGSSGTGSSSDNGSAKSDGTEGSHSTSDSGAGEALKDGVAMTTDQLNEAKSRLSDADKDQLFNVMKKLPQTAWQQISSLMEGGLTADEMTQVQQLIAQHLDRDEYDSMMKILKKY